MKRKKISEELYNKLLGSLFLFCIVFLVSGSLFTKPSTGSSVNATVKSLVVTDSMIGGSIIASAIRVAGYFYSCKTNLQAGDFAFDLGSTNLNQSIVLTGNVAVVMSNWINGCAARLRLYNTQATNCTLAVSGDGMVTNWSGLFLPQIAPTKIATVYLECENPGTGTNYVHLTASESQ